MAVDDEKVEKDSNKKNKDGSKKYIEIHPTLDEAASKTVVISFGRFSPPTVGHEKLVNKINDVAMKMSADAAIYASHTFDTKKNPLTYNSKIKYLQQAFGKSIRKSNAKTIIDVAKELSGQYGTLVVVVGSDRIAEFQTLLNKYNGKDFTFDSIQVISAGDRDPDADDVSGMSASKLRSLVAQGDFVTFRMGLPKKLQSSAQKLYDELRTNMKIMERLMSSNQGLDLNDQFESFLESVEYHSGGSAIDKRNAEFNKGTEMGCDTTAVAPKKKRFHQLYKKEGSVNCDRRFKIYREKKNVHFAEEFLDDATDLMETVESLVENEDSKISANREQGTNSLVRIYKKDTPGEDGSETNEAYFQSELENDFGPFEKGSRIRFTDHSMDMVDEVELEKEGVVVGSNAQHLRVRDDRGVLYKVRHSDAELVEQTIFFTLDESFEFRFLDESSMMDRAVAAIHRHILKGKNLENTVWEFVRATGASIGTQDLMRQYISTYGNPAGNPADKPNPNAQLRSRLLKKYS